MMTTSQHYRAPGWFTRNVFNRTVAGLTRVGVSVLGSRVLETRGRQRTHEKGTRIIRWGFRGWPVLPMLLQTNITC